MIIDSSMYSGACDCGREHLLATKGAVIEPGALLLAQRYLDSFGVSGKRCALYGENGYRATAGRRPQAEQTIVLPSEGLHADEVSTAEVLERMDGDTEVIFAVGSGTIHDIARFCAHQRGIRFVSFPTAASVDGFCSTVASMMWHGYKKTIPCAAPELVIADTDVVRAAPSALVRSGVGDMLAKYTALADWEIAHALTGEYFCKTIWELVHKAVTAVEDSIAGIAAGSGPAYENVMAGLILSGLAMQMIGNSRPASGAEHHISHLIEMRPAGLPSASDTLHGERTGVGAVLVSEVYHRLAALPAASVELRDGELFSREEVYCFFGPALAQGVLRENGEDCQAAVDGARLRAVWPQICRSISRIPPSDCLEAILKRIGARHSPEDLGLGREYLPALLRYSPLVRNRLTLMRIRCRMTEGSLADQLPAAVPSG